jgi:hypothetical protein
MLVVVAALLPGPVEAQSGCQFTLGFKALRDLIPERVGDCLDNESHNPENGDGLQHTTAWHGQGGLLVWRKADNWTAFTDGATTWIRGPLGLQSRPNNGPLFAWEAPTGGRGVEPAASPRLLVVRGARPGQIANVVIETSPGAACGIRYVTPAGAVGEAWGLMPRTADGQGRISWSWFVSVDTRPGTGSVTVTCGQRSVSASLAIG